ncbi:transposase [Streptomyces sp. NBC_01795]|uniref:transposase n=1 Tax=unclassified Streptomyces TaxID=2593676 RepID=UPI002DDC197D|nr:MULTISPECIES: transposase [unclassified Streptomyces]WSA95547.1 transposase [Streptomyces sp. NBC_01795]WSB79961.1 transposase [Streptomyces sp. NBC_01775]WSS11831.1 transposase [Streptomyces sp. NBC_01186]
MNDTQRNRGHHRVANLRADAPHKLSTTVTAEYGTVVVEDLNVAGMLRNRGLARRIADAGFGEVRRPRGSRNHWYRSGWRPGRASAETSWSRPEDPHHPPQPQGRDGRAGGATLPHQRQTEGRDRTQAEALTLW